ncbi:MAG TPA: hypothetical protein VFX76_03415, partial [Roseiflexaceae bacterium]|nr:hypothetical protein [Roseiflexaceae bacterium]
TTRKYVYTNMALHESSQHKADTGPLSLPPAALLPQRRPIWQWLAAALAFALLAGIVLFVTRPSDPLTDQRPVEVVRGFVAALEARDASQMLAYAVPTDAKKELGPEVRAYLEYVDSLSFSDANYTLIDNDGERAHVRWTGTMHYRLNFGSEVKAGDKPIDTVYELTKFEGAWYLSSVTPPQA